MLSLFRLFWHWFSGFLVVLSPLDKSTLVCVLRELADWQSMFAFHSFLGVVVLAQGVSPVKGREELFLIEQEGHW
jgi:hypothetical protein